MPDAAYDVAVRLSLSMVGFAGATGAAVKALRGIESQAAAAQQAVARFQQQGYMAMQGMNAAERQAYKYGLALDAQAAAQEKATAAARSFNLLLAGGILTGVGIAGVSVMNGWVKSAATMQDSLTQVGNAAQGTQAQLTALYNDSFKIAGATQFSAPQILDMAKVMGVHGFADPTGKLTQRQVIDQALPMFAQAAEINFRMKGTSYQDTVAALTQQAHMFGSYSGQALQDNVQLSTRAGLASGMTPDQQTNVLRYIMPAVKGLGVSSFDAYSLAALANQTGLTLGKGGSNLGALFRYMIPGGSKAHQEGLSAIEGAGGGSFFTAQGKFEGIGNALKVISTFMAAPGLSQAARLADLTNAFKVQGEQAAVALGTPNATKQYGNIVKELQPYDPLKNPTGYASVTEMQQKLNQTLVGQMQTLTTNLSSISAMMGKELVPAAVHAANAFVSLTGGVIAFGTQHPLLVQLATDFTAIVTAVSLVAGPILLVKGAWGLLNVPGMIKGVGALIETVRGLAVSEAIAAGAARALAFVDAVGTAGVAVLSAAYTGLNAVVIALSGGFDIATISAAAFDVATSPVIAIVGGLVLAGTAVYMVFQNWSTISGVLGNMLGWLGGKLHDFLVMVGLAKDQTKTNGVPNLSGNTPMQTGAAHAQTINGQSGHFQPGYRGAQVWVPDRAAGTGRRGGGAPASPAVHLNIKELHVHDAGAKSGPQLAKDVVDHLPAEAWNKITAHVNAHNAAQAQHDHLYGSIDPVGLTPGLFGS